MVIGTLVLLMGWDPQVAVMFWFSAILLIPLFLFVGIWDLIAVYAGGFGHHYADYVYRADGDISNALQKLDLHLQAPINTNWCAAGD